MLVLVRKTPPSNLRLPPGQPGPIVAPYLSVGVEPGVSLFGEFVIVGPDPEELDPASPAQLVAITHSCAIPRVMDLAVGYRDVMDIGADGVGQRLLVFREKRPQETRDFSQVNQAAMETVTDLVVVVDKPQPITLVDQMDGQPVGALVGVERIAKIPDALGDCIPDLAVDVAIAADGLVQGSDRAVAGVLIPGLAVYRLEIRQIKGFPQQACGPISTRFRSRRRNGIFAPMPSGLKSSQSEQVWFADRGGICWKSTIHWKYSQLTSPVAILAYSAPSEPLFRHSRAKIEHLTHGAQAVLQDFGELPDELVAIESGPFPGFLGRGCPSCHGAAGL